jgi:hypothetical protein
MTPSWRRSESGALTDAQEGFRATNTVMVGLQLIGEIKSNHRRSDSFTLVYVDSFQRMISHTVRLVATAAQGPPLSRRPSHSGVIGLPNPFKALRTAHLGAPDTVEIGEVVGRVEVDTQVELGVVPIEGSIIANRTVLTSDGRRAIFWTESELTVGTSERDGGHPLTCIRLLKQNPAALGRFGQQRCLRLMPGGSIKVHSC